MLADNGSTDGVPERAAAAHGDVRVLPHRRQRRLRRRGQRRRSPTPTSGWALVANPDIRFEAGAVDELLDGGGALAAGGDDRPGHPHAARAASTRRPATCPSLSTGIGHALLGWLWPANPWTARYRREREDPRERTAGWLSGSCFLVDLEAFHSVDGFDPGYFMYFEDVDLAERLGRRGWLHVYVPSAVVDARGRPRHLARAAPDAAGAPHQRAALPVGAVPLPAARAAALARCGPGSAPGCCSPTSATGSAPAPSSSGPRPSCPRAPATGCGASERRPAGRSTACSTR